MESIVIAVAESGRGEAAVLATIPNDTRKLLKRLRALGQVKCCYEAGPTGYGLYRTLKAEGIDCIVVAPSLVPRKGGERVKTDRRDAVRLARFLRSGDLTEVSVPDAATEAIRDLERARDDAKRAERVARQQLGKFLLRHGKRFPGKTTWSKVHLRWLHVQAFEHPAQQAVLQDYLKTAEDLTARVKHLTDRIEELVESWHLAPLVKAFQGMRGISLISAVTLAAEVCDFARFESAPRFMSYVGLVPARPRRGRLDVPVPRAHERRDPRSKQGASSRGPADRLACAGAALRALPEPRCRREEQKQGRHRGRPRTRWLRLVHRQAAVDRRSLSTPSDGEGAG